MADGFADEGFGDVVAVALGGVEDGIHVGLDVVHAPLAADLSGADADDRDSEAGASEGAVFHDGSPGVEGECEDERWGRSQADGEAAATICYFLPL